MDGSGEGAGLFMAPFTLSPHQTAVMCTIARSPTPRTWPLLLPCFTGKLTGCVSALFCLPYPSHAGRKHENKQTTFCFTKVKLKTWKIRQMMKTKTQSPELLQAASHPWFYSCPLLKWAIMIDLTWIYAKYELIWQNNLVSCDHTAA